ncbi:MAG: electron transfer flavoprotein beta subunit/FixA family protein [Candidatus Neomarinimicrobiota bacterium]|nr:MAG: electron transfer flavoprotein beta subunit/FixA family protein [Candidatus Neomarinimicrobiota bacterium]
MSIHLVVLAKQVPDTHNITGEAMKPDGTVNRAALPAIFNPEDLNALEMALQCKERYGARVTVITMGPPRAADILREALYRGADDTILITDRAFAGADTLATSYVLAKAIEKIGDVDLVLAGRQAIDGDTAQIGPQVAEKIGYNQITYVEAIQELKDRTLTVHRSLGRVTEIIQTRLPVLITVTSSANKPRTFGAKRMIKYKKARSLLEIKREVESGSFAGHYGLELVEDEIALVTKELREKNLLIETWSAADLDADPDSIGLRGSPTKVKKVISIVLAASETKDIPPTEEGIHDLITELIEDRTFG